MSVLIDMVGVRVGRLVVVSRAEGGGGEARWVCQCDCGGTKAVLGSLLRNAHTSSCGCLHKENARTQAFARIGSSKPQRCGTVAAYRRGCRCDECMDAIRLRSRTYYQDNKESVLARSREHALRRKYGLTIERMDALFQAQGRSCKCCGVTSPGHKFGWHIDHDHRTGEVRGIVCAECNRVLGMLGDNLKSVIDRADLLIKYLTAGASSTKETLVRLTLVA